MAPIDQQSVSAPVSVPPKLSADWPAFAQRLASVLGALQEDQYLASNGPQRPRSSAWRTWP